MRCRGIFIGLLAAGAALSTAPVSAELAGIEQPAEIIVDQWGVAHIYAGTDRDALFLQGYNGARDRL